jgi:type IV secretion system protein TrbG
MKLTFKTIAIFLCLLSIAKAKPQEDIDNAYFAMDELALTRQETAALALTKAWADGNRVGIKPFVGANGSIEFVFGAQYTSIVCAVLQVCDIELEPGEEVKDINVGDKARWLVEPSISGVGDSETQHLIIKPKDVNLNSSLIVTTNRRTYHLQLKSTLNRYMHHVSFIYPENAEAKWQKLLANKSKEISSATMKSGRRIDELDFNYELLGDAPWKPVRVYNDSQKTIIEMPEEIDSVEAPALLELRDDGGLFSEDSEVLVNYRIQNNKYIVDSVFKKAVLVAGVGSRQSRVTIVRR